MANSYRSHVSDLALLDFDETDKSSTIKQFSPLRTCVGQHLYNAWIIKSEKGAASSESSYRPVATNDCPYR